MRSAYQRIGCEDKTNVHIHFASLIVRLPTSKMNVNEYVESCENVAVSALASPLPPGAQVSCHLAATRTGTLSLWLMPGGGKENESSIPILKMFLIQNAFFISLFLLIEFQIFGFALPTVPICKAMTVWFKVQYLRSIENHTISPKKCLSI
jgi:hypothetical protein